MNLTLVFHKLLTRLIHHQSKMRQFFKNIVLVLLLLYVVCLRGNAPNAINGKEFYNLGFQDSIEWADYYFNIHRYEKAIPIYEKNLEDSDIQQKVHTLKKLSLSEAALHNPKESITYVYDYFKIVAIIFFISINKY